MILDQTKVHTRIRSQIFFSAYDSMMLPQKSKYAIARIQGYEYYLCLLQLITVATLPLSYNMHICNY